MFDLVNATPRDLREFLDAKKRKREPVIRRAFGQASAVHRPSSATGFTRFRFALRAVADWGQASERVDSLERELQKRAGVRLPTPTKVIQNPDRSISLFWEGAMARLFVDGVFTLIGGFKGKQASTITPEFLDILAFQKRIQQEA